MKTNEELLQNYKRKYKNLKSKNTYLLINLMSKRDELIKSKLEIIELKRQLNDKEKECNELVKQKSYTKPNCNHSKKMILPRGTMCKVFCSKCEKQLGIITMEKANELKKEGKLI